MLEDEPQLTEVELLAYKSSGICEGISDIVSYGNALGILDLPAFIELTLHCKSEKQNNAKD